MSAGRPEYIMVDGVRTLITAELCRDKVAEFRFEIDNSAMLPDTMGTGRRASSIVQMRRALASQLAIWDAKLYDLTGGAEGNPFGRMLIPT